MIKFHKKAITIYAVAQKAQGSKVTIPSSECTGTVSTTVGSTAVVGVGTSFLTQATENAYIYTATGYEIGRIKTITDNTNIVLFDAVPAAQIEDIQSPATKKKATAVTGVTYQFGLGGANAYAALDLTFSNEITTEAAQYVGDELDRDEDTWVKDSICNVDFSMFCPALGLVSHNAKVASGTNTIATELGSTHRLRGVGTTFVTDLTVGSLLYTAAGLFIGVVKAIHSQTILELAYPAKNLTSTPVIFQYANPSAVTAESEAPALDLFQALSLGVELGTGYVKYTNEISSNVYLEVEYRLSSADIAGTFKEKCYRTNDVRGMVDFDIASIGTRAKFMVKLQGNLTDIAQVDRLVANYGVQKTEIAETVNTNTLGTNINMVALVPHYPVALVGFPASITTGQTVTIAGLTFTAGAGSVTLAQLVDIWSAIPDGTGYVAANTLKSVALASLGTFTAGTMTGWSTTYYGDELTQVRFVASLMTTAATSLLITGTATAGAIVIPDAITATRRPNASNLCFEKLNAPNVAGFEFTRYMLSCEAGWAKGAIPSDVTITIVEDSADAEYNPYDFFAVRHLLAVNWGNAATNTNVDVEFTSALLAKITKSEVSNYIGQDLNMRSVGKFSLTLR